MKKYNIVKRIAEISYRKRETIIKGCTLGDEYPEIIKSFDKLEDAKEELRKHNTSVCRRMRISNNTYFLIEEYMIEEKENKNGEWENNGVVEITDMGIYVRKRSDCDFELKFNEYKNAEEYIKEHAGEDEYYISC